MRCRAPIRHDIEHQDGLLRHDRIHRLLADECHDLTRISNAQLTVNFEIQTAAAQLDEAAIDILKNKNGPDAAIVATLIRQLKPSPAPIGPDNNSRVIPAPFFQVNFRLSASRIIIVRVGAGRASPTASRGHSRSRCHILRLHGA